METQILIIEIFTNITAHIFLQYKLKCLGITIDANLKWDDHIKNMSSKMRLLFYKFITLRNTLAH